MTLSAIKITFFKQWNDADLFFWVTEEYGFERHLKHIQFEGEIKLDIF